MDLPFGPLGMCRYVRTVDWKKLQAVIARIAVRAPMSRISDPIAKVRCHLAESDSNLPKMP